MVPRRGPPASPPQAAAQAEGLEEILGQFGQKTARRQEGGRAAPGADLRDAKIELVLRARHGDVEQAALLVEVALLDRASQREHALGQAEHEHDAELEPLGLVHGGEPERVGVGIDLAVARLGIEQRDLREQVLQVVEPAGEADQRLQVVEARGAAPTLGPGSTAPGASGGAVAPGMRRF